MIVLSSCGTLENRNNYVAISADNEFGFTIDEESYRGSQIVEISPDRQKNFYWWSSANSYENLIKLDCDVRFGDVIGPDLFWLVFPPIGIGVSGISLLTDFWTGQLYDCNQFVQLSERAKGKRVLLYPVSTPDFDSLKEFEDDLISGKAGNLGDLEIIPPEVYREELSFKGYSYHRRNIIDERALRQTMDLAKKYGADYLLGYEQIEDSKKITYRPKLYSYYDGKPQEQDLDTIVKPIARKDGTFLGVVKTSLQLVPNTFAMIAPTNVSLNTDEGSSTNKKAKGLVYYENFAELFLNAFAAKTLTHPQWLNPWDYELFLAPVIDVYRFRAKGPESNVEVKWRSMQFSYVAGVNFQTPLGIFSVDYGGGPSFRWHKRNHGVYHHGVRFYTRFSVQYTKFISDRWFFVLTYLDHDFRGDKALDDTLKFRNWTEAGIGIGYFFPEIINWVNKLL